MTTNDYDGLNTPTGKIVSFARNGYSRAICSQVKTQADRDILNIPIRGYVSMSDLFHLGAT